MPSRRSPATRWRAKLERPGVKLPKIVPVPPKWRKRYGAGTMLIAHPLDVDALIRRVRKGRVITQARLRERLARDFRADHTCPLTTGIFVRIVAEAAEEGRRAGRTSVTPYWRVVRDDGSLNERFPGGVQAQARRLRAEGLSVAAGKKPCVRDFERRLARL